MKSRFFRKRTSFFITFLFTLLLIILFTNFKTSSSTFASSTDYTKPSDLAGQKIASITGTVFEKVVTEKIPDVTVVSYNQLADSTAALKQGKVEALVTDDPPARMIVAKNSDLKLIEEAVEEDHYGIALQKNSPYNAKVNELIAEFKKDGTLDELKSIWTGTDDSKKVLPEQTGTGETIEAVVDASCDPMTYAGENGAATGYSVDLLIRIANRLDLKVNFTLVDFSGLIPMLQSGKADMAIGAISITEERKKLIDLSDSYYDGGIMLVLRKSDATTAVQETF